MHANGKMRAGAIVETLQLTGIDMPKRLTFPDGTCDERSFRGSLAATLNRRRARLRHEAGPTDGPQVARYAATLATVRIIGLQQCCSPPP